MQKHYLKIFSYFYAKFPKMKNAFITLLILSLAIVANAQGPVNIGLKFGYNSSKLITEIEDVKTNNLEKYDINNYLAGAFARISLGRLYVQPEVYFNKKGGFITPISETQLQIPQFSFQTIDVPVLVGFKIIDKSLVNVRVNTGPVFSYITGKELENDIANFDPNELTDRYVAWQLGAGVDFWFVTLDLRVESSSNLFNDISSFSAKNRVYLLSAGIKLF